MDTSQHGRSARTVVRYGLLQLPGLALLVLFLVLAQRWFDIPSWLAWGFLALWVAKDAALYPFVRRSYDRDQPRDMNPMLGAHGIARDRLAPSGYILVHGELWQAEVTEGSPPIEKGKGALVRGTRGLTLIVEPDNEEGIG
jgi:membrane protein implicated in regulation of membrane protease activity